MWLIIPRSPIQSTQTFSFWPAPCSISKSTDATGDSSEKVRFDFGHPSVSLLSMAQPNQQDSILKNELETLQCETCESSPNSILQSERSADNLDDSEIQE